MEDKRKISLVIPTWNRFELLIDSFINVLQDERISEVVICDDASDIEIYNKIQNFVDGITKIKLFRNAENLDCYKNKKTAISHASNDWSILFDSDNVIKTDYIDCLFSIKEWQPNTSYMPSLAAPTFNYEHLTGYYDSRNVNSYFGQPLFDTMLNCMNLFINKNEYLELWDESVTPHTADSLYFNYCWFAAGNKMFVVPDLKYFHRIHPDSHYIKNNHKTNGFYEKTLEMFKELK